MDVLDGMEGKLTNAKWAAIGKCSADTALRDINDLLTRGVLGRLEGGGRSTGCLLVKLSCSPGGTCEGSYKSSSIRFTVLGGTWKSNSCNHTPGANAYRSGRITLTLFENSFPNYTAPKMEEAMKNKAIATDTSYAMQGEL